MMYPFMTLDDGTEIVHSDYENGKVKVYIETPDEKVCFKHATCYLPSYQWEDIYEYSQDEIERFSEILLLEALGGESGQIGTLFNRIRGILNNGYSSN